jgi:hypothetical protein
MENTFPNFFILGAAKAGTTSLYDLLSQHPQVFMTFDKEPMFFSRDDYFERGADWYTKTFFSESERFLCRGEASPHYLYWAEKVSKRIYDLYGNEDIKFIVIFRNPIERAYSWYWNMVADGREELSFEDALSMESERFEKKYHELYYFGSMQYGYLRGGNYSFQIGHFLRFFRRDQFLFLLQDELKQGWEKVLRKTCSFLGVSSKSDIRYKKSNQAGLPRSQHLQEIIRNPSAIKNLIKPFLPDRFRHRAKLALLKMNKKDFHYPVMSEKAYQFLSEYYRQEVEDLSSLLEIDLSYWSK